MFYFSSSFPFLFAFAVGGLGFEFCAHTHARTHTSINMASRGVFLVSGWPFINTITGYQVSRSQFHCSGSRSWVSSLLLLLLLFRPFLQEQVAPLIIIINRRSGITSHTSHSHKTGTRSMQPVRSVPLGGPVVS